MSKYKKATLSIVAIMGLSSSILVNSSDVKQQLIDGLKEQDNLADDIRAADKKSDALVRAIEKELTKIRETINEQKPLQDKWMKAIEELEKSQLEFMNHLKEMYLHNGTEILAQILATEDLQQIFDALQAAQNIVAIDKRICDDLQAKADQVEESKKAYDEKLAAIEEKIKEYQQNKAEIIANISDSKERVRALKLFEEDHELEMRVVIDERLSKGTFAWDKKLSYPVRSPRITSGYGMRHGKMHKGIDLQRADGESLGAPVLAAATGRVIESKPSSGYGWLIIILHGYSNGVPVVTCYAHSYPHQVLVRPGQIVKQGEQITSIGNYGDSTGAHCHFEIREGNVPVNPMKYLR